MKHYLYEMIYFSFKKVKVLSLLFERSGNQYVMKGACGPLSGDTPRIGTKGQIGFDLYVAHLLLYPFINHYSPTCPLGIPRFPKILFVLSYLF